MSLMYGMNEGKKFVTYRYSWPGNTREHSRCSGTIQSGFCMSPALRLQRSLWPPPKTSQNFESYVFSQKVKDLAQK